MVLCYYSYNVGRRKEIGASSPSDEPTLRVRRYVDTVIPRLADNYVSPYDKDDAGRGIGRRRDVMDMLGNVAVRPSGPPAATLAPHDVITIEQTTTLAAPTNVDKKAPLEDKEMSKATKKILSNSPPKTAVQPNVSMNVSNADNKSGIDSNLYTHPDVNIPGNVEEYPKDITNSTLKQQNITSRQDDHHVYYNSSFLVDPDVGRHYWVNLSSCAKPVTNEILSKSHRRATTVRLDFDFPFYGHPVRNIAIATGGFLYVGNYIHSWLAATQYIAPLMANFDTSINNASQVKYCDNGTSFTVEWENVLLQDRKDSGEFTFQVTLHNTGDIVFVYKKVPMLVEEITDDLHPVKVGLSDAYIIEKTVFFVRRKTIYEYHRVNFNKEDIKDWTVINLTPLETCLSYSTCETCLNHDTSFDCKWCPNAERCSSGFDRHRQDWQAKHCDIASIGGHNASVCANAKSYKQLVPQVSNKLEISSSMNSDPPQVATVVADRNTSQKAAGFGHTGMMGLLLFVLMISGVGLWVLYAYRNPHTQSGQVLIKYRPSQWALRRGEASYERENCKFECRNEIEYLHQPDTNQSTCTKCLLNYINCKLVTTPRCDASNKQLFIT
ncbi:hypothetical protein GE061_008326 [Apolygus lucorum]|uniref:PSI domain-containing protein n=1 Tax=Apolygus lucorum TaxID=248454 RepID=A0A8S9WR19_APOLU|nr:hypothetical protein GE061_008326 [Apolygus lucorum]